MQWGVVGVVVPRFFGRKRTKMLRYDVKKATKINILSTKFPLFATKSALTDERFSELTD